MYLRHVLRYSVVLDMSLRERLLKWEKASPSGTSVRYPLGNSENANAEELIPYYSGDRVAIEAGVPCSKSSCDYCRIGRYNACKFPVCSIIRQSIMCGPFLGPDVVFFSTPPFHGMNSNHPGIIDV